MGDIMGVLFLVILAVISYTDIRRRQIPNWCCGCIAALAVISDAVFFSAEIFDFEICQKLAFSEIFAMSLTERMLGALCVSVPMLGITVLAPGSFGGGDVKFMCAAGALLGWRHILWSAAAGIFCRQEVRTVSSDNKKHRTESGISARTVPVSRYCCQYFD